jgi:HPt (histidine-containing phosphotransfer) domain-containing protein
LQHFLPSARELLEALRQSIKEEMLRQVCQHAHQLQGACVDIGASGMSQLARRMERAGEGPDWEEIYNTMKALDHSFERVEAFVRGF